jgi:hypothetical protein
MHEHVSGTRAKVRDAAFQYRMGAGFAGDVNRTHPAEIEPVLVDGTNYPTQYGQAVVLDGTSHKARHLIASDTAVTNIFGSVVRPYPLQDTANSNMYAAAPIGASNPPKAGIVDVLRSGLIMVQLNTGSADPVKGGAVFVWVAATSGNHVQGGFETAASSGNTAALDPKVYQFNGAPDANGIVELSVNV